MSGYCDDCGNIACICPVPNDFPNEVWVPFSRIAAMEAERDFARVWSARWKAVATRLWGGVHRNLDINERLAKRMQALEAENARLRAALEDIAQTTGRVGLFPTDTLIEILDVARAALAASAGEAG